MSSSSSQTVTATLTYEECREIIRFDKKHPNLSESERVACWTFPKAQWRLLAECACNKKSEKYLEAIICHSELFTRYEDLNKKSYLDELIDFTKRRDNNGSHRQIMTILKRLRDEYLGVQDEADNTCALQLPEDSDDECVALHIPETDSERKLTAASPGAVKDPCTPNEYACVGCKERGKIINSLKEVTENLQSLSSFCDSSHPRADMKEVDEESQQRKMEDILKVIQELSYDDAHTCEQCRKIDTILQPMKARSTKPSECPCQCSRSSPCRCRDMMDELIRAKLDNTDCPDSTPRCYMKILLEDRDYFKHQYERLHQEREDTKKEPSCYRNRYGNPSSTSDDQV
jgi:hypothetical protein